MKLLLAGLLFALALVAQNTPPSGGGSSVIACVGTPGNTTGAYRQQCQTSAGLLYACNNAAGCALAADWIGQSGGTPAWGGISGTLSNQTDLQTALNGKAASSAATTVNGQSCALGSTCTVTATPSGVVSEALGGTGANNTTGVAGHVLRSNGTHYVDSAIQAADVPTLNQNTSGTASNVTGVVAEANGGTGANNTPGAAGHYLRSNGTHYVDNTIQAADVPTLNQSTTGNAATANQLFDNLKAISSSPYTVLAADSYITCDATTGPITINLPAATGSGREISVKKIDSTANACTPTRAGSDTIDGATSYSLTVQYAASKVVDQASGSWGRSHVNQLGGDVSGISTNVTVTKINGTAFAGTSGHLTSFGASNTPADSGIVASAVTQTIASGTASLGTGAISSATCATVVTVTATGTATTDVVQASFNGDPTAVTGYIPATSGMLTIIPYPTSGNVNFKVCNNTSASITPGAITLNWRVSR